VKANYKTANGRLTFEVSGETVKDIFMQVALVQEVFDADQECGCCKSKNLRFQFRQVESFKFYELACGDCRARMSFGQSKDQVHLFPKRKGEDGRWLENRGWKYQPVGQAATAAPPASAPGLPAAPATAKPEEKNGVAVFATWNEAENSPKWGSKWLIVAGNLYQLVEGNYKFNRKAA
jgi:hypothetical protein